MGLVTPDLAWDVGTKYGPLPNQAPQMLLEEGPDSGALIGHSAHMGENPLWLATTNDGEVHTPLQGDTSIGANEWMMMIDDFLDGGSDPIVRGMEADAHSMLSGRRRVSDGPRYV
jgi:hypothetical protein